MRSIVSWLVLSLTIILLPAGAAWAEPNIQDTRLLSQPAVSARHVAFIYADSLWVADLDGRNVRRLTSDVAAMYPVFSPDGATIAFSAQYDGNIDVYVIPVAGGSPTRLTWHPAADIVRGFTPDGRAVLFSSPRHVFTHRYRQLFTVPLGGGMPTQLPIPHAAQACFSPDGQQIAYTPLADAAAQWKHYRGGTHSRIWIFHRDDHRVERDSRSRSPAATTSTRTGSATTIYFRSDRNGEYNLFAYDTNAKTVQQLTEHADFPVVHVGSGGGRLIYEQAGYLHLFDPAAGDQHAAEDRRGDRPGRQPGRGTSRARRSTSATPTFRPSGRGPCSNTAARSSPCRPRRATRAT